MTPREAFEKSNKTHFDASKESRMIFAEFRVSQFSSFHSRHDDDFSNAKMKANEINFLPLDFPREFFSRFSMFYCIFSECSFFMIESGREASSESQTWLPQLNRVKS